MASFFHNELDLYMSFYNREREKAENSIGFIDVLVTNIKDNAETIDNHRDLHKYIRIMSTFCEVAATFNSKVDSLIASINESTFDQVLDAAPLSAEQLRVYDWLHADLTPYQEGGTFRGIVSFISDRERNICFIKDESKSDNLDYRDYIESEIEGIPDIGYMFAVEMQEVFLRAVRINMTAMSTSIQVRLIDIGDTVSITPNITKFKLNAQAHTHPPKAILCQVQKVNGCVVQSLDSIGLKRIHYDIKIREIGKYVNKCHLHMLEVDLYLAPDKKNLVKMDKSVYQPIIEEPIESPDNEILSRCFAKLTNERPSLCNGNSFLLTKNDKEPSDKEHSDKDHSDKDHSIEIERPKVPNASPPKLPAPVIPPRTRPPAPLPFLSPPKIRIPARIASLATRTKPQETTVNLSLNPFDNLSLNPFDSFGNSDDDNQNFDLNVKLCPCDSGAHPKINNTIPPAVDSIDLLPPPLPARLDISLPPLNINDEIMIHPTFISAVDHMYVQIYPQNEDYIEFLNKLSTVHHKLIRKRDPGFGELVIAKYSLDGGFYRARIEDMPGFDTYKVFFVDYGNTDNVKLDDILEWHHVCDTLPFQAISCYMPSMRQQTDVDDGLLIKSLESFCINRTCKAVVKALNNDRSLNIVLLTDDDRDVFEYIRAV